MAPWIHSEPTAAAHGAVRPFYCRVVDDVSSGARIFQITGDVLLPMIVLFVATTDWTRPFKRLRLLAFITVVVGLAFAALYYLGNYFHTAHHY